MKSSKTLQKQYGNAERKKTSKRHEKAPKLDRKSSRGMIYENEELRLRTININAEVERGQSDIKRLRRENEHLRREIWTLRDECDRLNKRFKAKLAEHDHGGCSARCSGGSGGCNAIRGSGGAQCDGHSHSNSDDSDSCDSCTCMDNQCTDECCQDNRCNQLSPKQAEALAAANEALESGTSATTTTTTTTTATGANSNDLKNLNMTFDHLSVVSEETLSTIQSENQQVIPKNELNGSQSTLPSVVGPLTPLTPIEIIATQFSHLQSAIPPLSYFENVIQKHMGSTVGTSPESSSTNSTGTTVRHTNGWDYNLQSPFAERKQTTQTLTSANATAISYASSSSFCMNPPLTTFVPTRATPPPIIISSDFSAETSTSNATNNSSNKTPAIETVAITTMSVNVPTASAGGSPKHFFAPLKPRLKLNTSLANKGLIPATVPIPPTLEKNAKIKCEPPDIFVTNGLASPYQAVKAAATSTTSTTTAATTKTITTNSIHPVKCKESPPPIPQRTSSPQVSPRHRNCHHQQLQQHEHHHHQQQQQQCLLQQTQQNVQQIELQANQPQQTTQNVDNNDVEHTTTTTTFIVATDVVVAVDDDVDANVAATAAVAVKTNASTVDIITTTTSTNTISLPKFFLKNNDNKNNHNNKKNISNNDNNYNNNNSINDNNCIEKPKSTLLTNLNEPIYATAQKCCKSLISATALTKPLMTAKTYDAIIQTTAASEMMSYLSTTNKSITAIKSRATTKTNINSKDCECQTESINLETLLHDIEAISEDILSIKQQQLQQQQTAKSQENIHNDVSNQLLQPTDKQKKPYRSEMNLYLTYDGTNSTTIPASTATTDTQTSNGSSEHNSDSPLPKIPAPMAPFPDNRKYIGFEKFTTKPTTTTTTVTPTTITTTATTTNQATATISPTGKLQKSEKATSTNSPPKPLPPVPPNRAFLPPLNIRCAGVARDNSTDSPTTATQTSADTTPTQNVLPNKSHLYASIANAAAKRALFRASSSAGTRSLDTVLSVSDTNGDTPTPENEELRKHISPQIDALKHKPRRVSVVSFTDPLSNVANITQRSQVQTFSSATTTFITPATASASKNCTNSTETAAGSCRDLSLILTNPTIQNLKQTSHSTPNSPHSLRRQTLHNSSETIGGSSIPPSPIKSTTKLYAHHHSGSTINKDAHYHHQHTNALSLFPGIHNRKMSGTSSDFLAAAAIVANTKCASRRHSEGTVAVNMQRISATSGGHHHHHHHHQHGTSLLGHNAHGHSHHSHHDSNYDLSLSDVSSFGSSRESSTNFSLRSNRRKISISSHTGGKIPWCGCWGNGCL